VYLDTCPKNDVISFFQKRFCALGLELGLVLQLGFELRLGLGLRLGLAEIRLNTFFGQTSIRSSVLDPIYSEPFT